MSSLHVTQGKITEKEGNVEIYVNDADSDEVTTLQKLNGNEIKAVSIDRTYILSVLS